ncbi:MAG: P-loop NTPase [Chloroflexi bacterium]|jgi:MinD superfamily P-loop ATPase|nr:P-loop NTPase [Chloroflexota bacterium]MBT7080498.1 P-loop NTPase [Chloroflexota bacterium]MBT7288937.1 P-loop NTPase [Chloroflexota bacterium]
MIISVASGKGGTGKTLVATSLALSIADEGVQILDCDVEEPNAHLLLNPNFESSEPVEVLVPQVDDDKCNYCGKCSEVCVYHSIAVMKERVLLFPELCHGCGACSYLCPEKAITEVGRQIGVVESGHANGIDFVHGKINVGEAMVPPVIRKVKDKINSKSIAIIDVPPGTSCPVVEAVRGSDYCILVTEPTPFGKNDLELAVQVMKQMNIPCGVIINRAGSNDKSVEGYCARENIPVLMKILLSTDIAKLYSKGIPLVDGMPEYRQVFRHLYDDIKKAVAVEKSR